MKNTGASAESFDSNGSESSPDKENVATLSRRVRCCPQRSAGSAQAGHVSSIYDFERDGDAVFTMEEDKPEAGIDDIIARWACWSCFLLVRHSRLEYL